MYDHYNQYSKSYIDGSSIVYAILATDVVMLLIFLNLTFEIEDVRINLYHFAQKTNKNFRKNLTKYTYIYTYSS